MNQIFNFQRFTLLIKRQWADNKKPYLLSVFAFIGLLSLWFVFLLSMDRAPQFNEELQRVAYLFCLFLGGAIFASQVFKDLGSKSKGINYLMMPASITEKLLSGMLFGIIGLFIVLTLSFYLVDATIIWISNIINEASGNAHIRSKVANVFSFRKDEKDALLYLITVFLSLQSLFLLGSVYFKRYSFIKTAILVFVLFMSFVFMEGYFQRNILSGGFGNNLSEYRIFQSSFPNQVINIPAWLSVITTGILKFAIAPLLWCATYFRLKEKEI